MRILLALETLSLSGWGASLESPSTCDICHFHPGRVVDVHRIASRRAQVKKMSLVRFGRRLSSASARRGFATMFNSWWAGRAAKPRVY